MKHPPELLTIALIAAVCQVLGGCLASDQPCVEGQRANQELVIHLGAEYREESEYDFVSSYTPQMPSCDGFDGLMTGMDVRARTTSDAITVKFCQAYHLDEVTSTLGTVQSVPQVCWPLGWMGISANCGRVSLDGCPWLVGYMIDYPRSEERGAAVGAAFETSGFPANRFTRVLVPAPDSDSCPELADDPGCADTWVVTLREP